MINKETVQTLTEEWLKDNDYFLVDINFAADDRIGGSAVCESHW